MVPIKFMVYVGVTESMAFKRSHGLQGTSHFARVGYLEEKGVFLRQGGKSIAQIEQDICSTGINKTTQARFPLILRAD